MTGLVMRAALAAVIFVCAGSIVAQPPAPGGAGQPTLDGTTANTFAASLRRVRSSLSSSDRARFDACLEFLERLFPEPEVRRELLHGAAARVIELGEFFRKQCDKDGDGDVSKAEMAAARAQIVQARLNANESAAIATLMNCASAQAQMKASGLIDVDDDGDGEYAFFGEMTGAVGIRGESGRPSEQRASPPFLSERCRVEGGLVERSGYLFQVWLPGEDGEAVSENASGGVGDAAPDAQHAEKVWCAYAWPVEFGVSGTRAFFVTPQGQVYGTDNRKQRYGGRGRAPSPYASFPKGMKVLGELPSKPGATNDGARWESVR